MEEDDSLKTLLKVQAKNGDGSLQCEFTAYLPEFIILELNESQVHSCHIVPTFFYIRFGFLHSDNN